METNDLDQRSPEWFAARLGKITASGFDNVLKKTKYGESEYKKNYRMQLAIERLTGTQAVFIPMNLAMRNGVEREPEARDAFAAATKLGVTECGVYTHPSIKNAYSFPTTKSLEEIETLPGPSQVMSPSIQPKLQPSVNAIFSPPELPLNS